MVFAHHLSTHLLAEEMAGVTQSRARIAYHRPDPGAPIFQRVLQFTTPATDSQ